MQSTRKSCTKSHGTLSRGFWYYGCMIRSRDLVLFVTIVFFLGIGVVVTLVLKGEAPILRSMTLLLDDSSNTPTIFSASPHKEALDRDANIIHLRNVLAQNPVTVIPSPSVESASSGEQEKSVEELIDGTFIQKCSDNDDSITSTYSWPLRDVSIQTQGVLREVVYTETHISLPDSTSVSSTTASSLEVRSTTLLQLPLYPLPLPEPHCVPSDTVGVTTAGALMRNSDVALYRAYGPDYLIGYARDGFPIYGYFEGTVDRCGGYVSAIGYRYTISPDRDFILGCFIATPSTFTVL